MTMDVLLPVVSEPSCAGCGACCQGIGSPVLLYASRPGLGEPHPYRPAGLPDDLIAEIDAAFSGLVRGQEPQEACLWYDASSQQCRHYGWRPQVCRDYELAGRACLNRRKSAGLPTFGS
jgi:uncharacterized protein